MSGGEELGTGHISPESLTLGLLFLLNLVIGLLSKYSGLLFIVPDVGRLLQLNDHIHLLCVQFFFLIVDQFSLYVINANDFLEINQELVEKIQLFMLLYLLSEQLLRVFEDLL